MSIPSRLIDIERVERRRRLDQYYQSMLHALRRNDLDRARRHLGMIGRVVDGNPDPMTWYATSDQRDRLSNSERGDLGYLLWRKTLRTEQEERRAELRGGGIVSPAVGPVVFLPATEGFVVLWRNRDGEVFRESLVGWAISGDGEPHAVGTRGRADDHAAWAVLAPASAVSRGVPEVVEVLEAIEPFEMLVEDIRTEADLLAMWGNSRRASVRRAEAAT